MPDREPAGCDGPSVPRRGHCGLCRRGHCGLCRRRLCGARGRLPGRRSPAPPLARVRPCGPELGFARVRACSAAACNVVRARAGDGRHGPHARPPPGQEPAAIRGGHDGGWPGSGLSARTGYPAGREAGNAPGRRFTGRGPRAVSPPSQKRTNGTFGPGCGWPSTRCSASCGYRGARERRASGPGIDYFR
jgi:hypothetical protein